VIFVSLVAVCVIYFGLATVLLAYLL